jgi:hypothetical protein
MSDQDKREEGLNIGGIDLGADAPKEPNAGENSEPQDYLSELVGEGKKYKEVGELAKGAYHAQTHIQRIEEENKRLRELAEKKELTSEKLSAVLDRLSKLDDPEPSGHRREPEFEEPIQKPDAVPTRDELAKIVADLLDERGAAEAQKQREERMKENQQKAWAKLSELYENDMSKAKAFVAEYVGDSRDRADILNRMIVADPDSFVDFMKAQKARSGGVNFSDSANDKKPPVTLEGAGQLTWARAREIRKSNPELYNSRRFQAALNSARDRDPQTFWGNSRKVQR